MNIIKEWQKLDPGDRMLAKFLIYVCVIIGAIGFGCEIFKARSKAAAYERVTGKHVTAWDAYWLDLKVQESVK